MNFSFAWPLCFLLFLPFALAAWRMLRRGRHVGVKFAPARRLPAKTAGWRAQVAALAPWIFLVGAALLVVAAARPGTSDARSSSSVDVIAIGMAVDMSESMEALDFTVPGGKERTRLDVVKEVFAKFVETRANDPIGLVTFGGYASLLVPLTGDHRMLLESLRGVQVPRAAFDERGRPIDPEEMMTAIGDGLMTSVACVKDAKIKSKIVILLSDGVSNTGAVDPDDAAAAAAKLGIRVYTIGVGTRAERTPYRERNQYGRSRIRYANMSFDEAQLKSIARKTGARYFGVQDEDGLKLALREIDSLEKTRHERTVYQIWHDYFPWFLVPGAILLLLAVSLQMFASRRLV